VSARGAAAGWLGCAGVVALLATAGSANAQTPLDRGSYLVNAVMVCDGCHTPRGALAFTASLRFPRCVLAVAQRQLLGS